jgi:hypothetical protein
MSVRRVVRILDAHNRRDVRGNVEMRGRRIRLNAESGARGGFGARTVVQPSAGLVA